MRRKRYLSVLAVVFVVSAASFWVTYRLWDEGIYPSIGYLIVPLMLYLFVLGLLMFFYRLSEQKEIYRRIERNEKGDRLSKSNVVSTI